MKREETALLAAVASGGSQLLPLLGSLSLSLSLHLTDSNHALGPGCVSPGRPEKEG